MTIIVYQDSKLFVDTTTFTDYSDAVPQQKWLERPSSISVYAGTQEDISEAIRCRANQAASRPMTELAEVRLDIIGGELILFYRENDCTCRPVIVLDDAPIVFANNALRACVKNYINTAYDWEEPVLVSMTKAGFFPAVVELSPRDGAHYLHKFGGSEVLRTSDGVGFIAR